MHVAGAGEALSAALESLKPERIVGIGCTRSRDDAMLAGEAGVDYVMFGDAGFSGPGPDHDEIVDAVGWWAEIFNVPCVGFARRLDEVEAIAAAGRRIRGPGRCRLGRCPRRRGGRGRGLGGDPQGRSHPRLGGSRCRRGPVLSTAKPFAHSGAALLSRRSSWRPGPLWPRCPRTPSPRRHRRHWCRAWPTRHAATRLSALADEPRRLEARPRTDIPAADLAFGAFQRGYFATALAEATTEAGKNPEDGSAMALIGEIYNQGLAVRTDPVEADRWFKLASERGNREGSFAYGLALLRGTGVAKDLAAAKPYLEKAAAQGHPGALYNLGVLALETDVKTRDYGGAAALFQHAADAGDIDALYALANLYKSGEGVSRDLAHAAELFKTAADERHPGAQIEYGIMAFNGEGLPKDEAVAAHYFQLAAYEGNPVAANRLARLYAAGRGVAKNSVEAAHWHLLARAAGVPDPWLDTVLAG